MDPEIATNINETLKKLESEGAELVPISLPHTKYGIATYYILATAEASSNLARFDGIRYGHRAEKSSVVDELKEEESRLREEFKDDQVQLDLELSKMDSALIKLYKNPEQKALVLK